MQALLCRIHGQAEESLNSLLMFPTFLLRNLHFSFSDLHFKRNSIVMYCLGYHFSCWNRGQGKSDFNRVAYSSLMSQCKAVQGCVGLHRIREQDNLQLGNLASSTCRFFLLLVQYGCSSSFHHVHIPVNRNREGEKLKGRTCLFLLKPQQRSSTQTSCSCAIRQNFVKQPN